MKALLAHLGHAYSWRHITAVLALIQIGAPILVIVGSAFSKNAYGLFTGGVTLLWFDRLFATRSLLTAFATSVEIALATTGVALCVALPTAIAAVRVRFPGRSVVLWLLGLPMLLPGVVVGLAGLSTLLRFGVAARTGPMVLVLTSVMTPLMLRPMVAALQQVDANQEAAARNLGATPLRAFQLVTVPQILPAMVAASLFCFVETLDNFAITAFLSNMHATTLPVETYDYIRDFDDPVVSALSTALTLLGLAFAVALDRVISIERFVDAS